MGPDYVLDASVAAKVFFDEEGSVAARAAVRQAGRLIAPDWILLDVASIAAKKIRSRAITAEQGRQIVADLPPLLDAVVPAAPLSEATFDLALAAMTSVYDAAYAALAAREGLPVLTADRRFAAALAAHEVTPPATLIGA
jgi:predicted nucleic acid-binding protein